MIVVIVLIMVSVLAIAGGYALTKRSEISETSASNMIAPTIMPVEIDPEREFGVEEKITVCENDLMVNSILVEEGQNTDFLVIHLEITNKSGSQVPINSFDFTIVDGNWARDIL